MLVFDRKCRELHLTQNANIGKENCGLLVFDSAC